MENKGKPKDTTRDRGSIGETRGEEKGGTREKGGGGQRGPGKKKGGGPKGRRKGTSEVNRRPKAIRGNQKRRGELGDCEIIHVVR